jgi:hypothetical protein
MTSLTVMVFVAGALAGARFNFVFLVPAILLGTAELAVVGFVDKQGLALTIEYICLTTIGLQLGFIGGIFLRLFYRPRQQSLMIRQMHSPSRK